MNSAARPSEVRVPAAATPSGIADASTRLQPVARALAAAIGAAGALGIGYELTDAGVPHLFSLATS